MIVSFTRTGELETDAASVARVVARLDALAQRWRTLVVGEALSFEWPKTEPN